MLKRLLKPVPVEPASVQSQTRRAEKSVAQMNIVTLSLGSPTAEAAEEEIAATAD
jgi:hypothetical protein